VLKQAPAAFETVAPGTKVTLTVSTGKVKLPDVTGKTFDDAQSILSPTFPNVSRGSDVVTHDQSKDGKVAKESLLPGNAYKSEQQITLNVYKYVPVTPSCPSTPATGSGSPSGGSSSTTPPAGGTSSSPC